MSETKTFESLNRTVNRFVAVVGAGVIGVGAVMGVQSCEARQDQVREWLQGRGVAECGDAPVTEPCIREVGLTTSIAVVDRPNAGPVAVSCFFGDNPTIAQEGCFIDPPGGFNDPNELVTGPQTILDA